MRTIVQGYNSTKLLRQREEPPEAIPEEGGREEGESKISSALLLVFWGVKAKTSQLHFCGREGRWEDRHHPYTKFSLRWCKEPETAAESVRVPWKEPQSAKSALSPFLPPGLYLHRPNITWGHRQEGHKEGENPKAGRVNEAQTQLDSPVSLPRGHFGSLSLSKATRGTKAALPLWLFPVVFYCWIDWLCWPQLFFLHS